jgi:hypothetical protein
MSDRSLLGDCCLNHSPLTAPVVYPHTVTRDLHDTLRAEYCCPECRREWPCWWDRRTSGWTVEDAESAA